MYWFLGGEFGSSFFNYTRIASTFSARRYANGFWNLLIQNFSYKPGEKKGNSSIWSRWNLGTARRMMFRVPVKLKRKGEIAADSAT